METFVYYTPTRVIFGTDANDRIGETLSSMGIGKVLVHYGSDRVVASGLLSKILAQLDSVSISHVELGGVQPNPKIGLVREGLRLALDEGVDMILAVGGGSVVDSSKAIALGIGCGIDPWEVIETGAQPERPFPVGVVLTMSSAGSEMSNSCVITDPERNLKRATNQDANRPVVAFMDPTETVTVPPYQTAVGAVDIMMHTMERYLTCEDPTPITDSIAVGILRTVREQTAILMNDPENIDARAQIMWASSLAHNGLTGCGRNMTFTAHKIEHDLSGMHDEIAHGAGLAVVFPAWCEHEYTKGIERFYTWARDVWGADPHRTASTEEEKSQAIMDAIATMRAEYASWGMPSTLSDLGVTPDEYDDIIALTTNGGTGRIPSFGCTLGAEEIREIYSLMEG